LRLFDGTPEYQKPPLYYWLVAGVARYAADRSMRSRCGCPGHRGMADRRAIIVFLLKRGRPGGLDCGFGPDDNASLPIDLATGRIDVR